MKRIIFDKFPGGKTSIVTMSFDDGGDGDIRLVKLFDKYGIKGTFHLISSHKNIPAHEYNGHEISAHQVNHAYTNLIPPSEQYEEWFQCRKDLEKYAGYIVRGASYPYGLYNDEIVNIAKSAGIVYSRTTKATKGFEIPDDFMMWHPTCHFKDALDLVDGFIQRANTWGRCLFYIWGHNFELRTEEDWQKMELLCQQISNNEHIWYATNIEIYDYIMAQKSLQISADKTMCYNPTNTDVWITVDDETVKIPKGETVNI